MIRTGMTSITFRKLSVKDVVELVAEAGLSSIEWGGDVHVPHGDARAAEEAKKLTLDHGLVVSSYGSYYRLAESEKQGLAFGAVLDSALTLGVDCVRVWAGGKGSSDADDDYWREVADDASRIDEMASKSGVSIAYEYHGGTLTDTVDAAEKLLNMTDSKTIGTYWQPVFGLPHQERMEHLTRMMPWLRNLHVFKWLIDDNGVTRLPLEQGRSEWADYIRIAAECSGDRYAILEFVRDDDPEQLKLDARVLKDILGE